MYKFIQHCSTAFQIYTLTLPPSTRAPPGPHTHSFELTEDELLDLYQGQQLTVRTSTDYGHDHELVIYVDRRLIGKNLLLHHRSCVSL